VTRSWASNPRRRVGTAFTSMKLADRDRPGLGILKIDVVRSNDPNFQPTDMCGTVVNEGRPCVREGGFRGLRNCEIRPWSAIKPG